MQRIRCKFLRTIKYTTNVNLSPNSFRMESDNTFTIRNTFAKCVVLSGSHLPVKSARSPSAQWGEFFGEQRTQFPYGFVSLVRVQPGPWQCRHAELPAPFPGSVPSAVPGLGGRAARQPGLCQAQHSRAGARSQPSLRLAGIRSHLIEHKLAFCSSAILL